MRGSTFHESWFKVKKLKPQLHASLRIYRQHYRGQLWYVVRDSNNNQFFRLNEAAYRFLAFLDGKRTVDQVWNSCQEEFGDDAPTQGEAITMLGQLYSSNLLQGDVPADTDELLNRHKKRMRQQVIGTLKGILFARIPLINPDSFLNRWSFIFGVFFRFPAYIVAFLFILAGGAFVLANVETLATEAQESLALSQLPWFYLAFVGTKLLHEFAHGFSCKYYGKANHKGGDVPTMGISLILLTPVPFVDASSSWALSNKWQRAAIAGAGMYVEFIIAAVAAVLWANTAAGEVIHLISFKVMLVCSITTILFNGNPLLRYDAYYIFTDILEIPNLASRSKIHLKYLFRRYCFGVKNAESSHHSKREALLLTSYGLAAEAYRFVLLTSIVIFFAYINAFLGILAVIIYFATSAVMPLLKWCQYLFLSPELQKNRTRALAISSLLVAGVIYSLFGFKTSDRVISEGVIEPEKMTILYSQGEGFVEYALTSEQMVTQGQKLLQSRNEELLVEIEKTAADKQENSIACRAYFADDLAKSMIYKSKIAMQEERLKALKQEKEHLTLSAPQAGIFIPQIHRNLEGLYIRKGEKIGKICQLDSLLVRSVIDQEKSRILAQTEVQVAIRIKGRPDLEYKGHVRSKSAYGSKKLPSVALGYAGGGEVEVEATEEGDESRRHFFNIIIDFDKNTSREFLRSGQVVSIRYNLEEKTFGQQIAQYLSRLFLKVMRV